MGLQCLVGIDKEKNIRMKYSLLGEVTEEYKSSLENKMIWAGSQVNIIHEDVRKYIEQEASSGKRYTNISLDIIKQYLKEDVSKDDGYFIVQSFIEKFEKESYYTVYEKKRLSFSLCGWDSPWINRDVYDDYRKSVMEGDDPYEKCRIKFLEYIYFGIKDACYKARENFCDELDYRKIFGDCYSDYLSLSDANKSLLANEVRSAIEDSGVTVLVMDNHSISLCGWVKNKDKDKEV